MAKVEDTEDNFKVCMKNNCSTCPSYPQKAGEGLYCARGPSEANVEKSGCNCPECPVWMENKLSGMYYCAESEGG